MKKALSLLLALSMVMSFFTVSAFADDEPTAADVVKSVTVSGTGVTGQNYTGGVLTVKYAYGKDAPVLTANSFSVTLDTNYYTLAAVADAVSYAANTNGNGGTLTVKYTEKEAATDNPPAAGTETPSATTETPSAAEPKTVDIGVTLTAEAKYTATVNLSAPGQAAFTATNVTVPTGVTLGELTTLDAYNGITYEGGKFIITDATKVTSKAYTYTFTGMAKTAEDETGVEATVTVTLNVTAATLNVNKIITNGSSEKLSGLAADIQTELRRLTGNQELEVSSVSIAAPGNDSIFTLYDGSTAITSSVTLSDSLTVTAKAGSIGSQALSLTAVAGGVTYKGTLTLKSDYKGAIVTAYQNALFAKEEFYLDSISGIAKVQKYSSSTASTSYTDTAVKDVTSYLVTPKTTDWTEELIGYDAAQVAYRVNVSFTAAAYDMGVVAVDGDAPFSADAFQTFVKAVNDEQSKDYSVALDTVKFTTVSGTGWTLYKGSAKLTATALSASDLKNVTIAVTKAGTYDIPFTVSYKYYATSTSTEATGYYYGIFRVIAVADGDIQYDVSYGQSVTFRTADFQSFYRTATGSSTATLSYVTFDELPAVGRLYTVPGKVTGGYWATIANAFYANPTATQLALSDVTYGAAYSPKTQYSVYIPFTAYGSGAAKSGVVEIVVNGEPPFTDVDENHTYYEYVKYVYNNNIMNGKTDTSFDTVSSLTRVQMVTILYRMAGSPTTYNSKVLTFTDSSKITNSEFVNAVKWAVNTGIVGGYDDGTFQPNAPVTRQAMIAVLYRYASKQGFATGAGSNGLAGFKDAGKVSNSMVAAMNWALEIGLLSGNAGYLNPTGSTTRGAAAKIFTGFHKAFIA
ncbi:MAG: S-layer homology domain-containing protein [Oscillospiraceae bacterium]